MEERRLRVSSLLFAAARLSRAPADIMGVPKLFRWLVERYPLVVHSTGAMPDPEFDNLYLDLNGVIHQCTHSNDEVASLLKKDKEVASTIFGLIETLFDIAKPKRLLYIAVDGSCRVCVCVCARARGRGFLGHPLV